MSRVARKAAAKFRKIQQLNSLGVDGRAEAKRMQTQWFGKRYSSPSELWNPTGKRLAN